MKKGIIYACKCKVNNKLYIGKTVQSLKRRKNNHKFEAFSNKRDQTKNYGFKFYNALKKHGWDNFEWIIIEENINEDLLSDKEKDYIKKYDSFKNGYNSTIGGERWGRKATDEERKRMSEDRKNRGVWIGENNPGYKKHGSKNPNYDSTKYYFTHPEYGERHCTVYDLRMEFKDLKQSNLSNLIHQRLNRYKKWELKKEV